MSSTDCHHRAPIGAVIDTTSDPDGFVRSVYFEPGFVCPVPRLHGRHGMQLRFTLGTHEGVTQLVLSLSDWLPNSVGLLGDIAGKHGTMSADLGHHWPAPTYEGEHRHETCEYLSGGSCWYDGSGLNAGPVLHTLVTDGIDAMWAELRGYWEQCNESALNVSEVSS